jgi:tRNA threonylcarbamoyladenosine biosynthesis protein TsaE
LNERPEIISHSEDETREFGFTIGKSLQGGELISLTGPLGSGKTVLARGIARGLEIDGPIRSPSFNLMREYHGRLILRHWDLYRLDSGFELLGLIESVSDDSVVIVEWAERWSGLDKFCTLNVNLNYGDSESNRVIRMTGD